MKIKICICSLKIRENRKIVSFTVQILVVGIRSYLVVRLLQVDEAEAAVAACGFVSRSQSCKFKTLCTVVLCTCQPNSLRL